MPEGPSILILKEAVQQFKGRKILEASGNLKTINLSELTGRKIIDFKSWGKHFLILLPKLTLRVHFLMFGSYTIDERKDRPERLRLVFTNGSLNFYSCAIRPLQADPDEIYDWSADVMNEQFDKKAALKKLRADPEALVCDALLDQDIFAGVGNIIKNEVLYRIRLHPESRVGNLPARRLRQLVDEAVNYSFDFLQWKKAYVLRAHWLAHNKKICPRDGQPFTRKHLGRTNRRSFYCEQCQKKY